MVSNETIMCLVLVIATKWLPPHHPTSLAQFPPHPHGILNNAAQIRMKELPIRQVVTGKKGTILAK